MIRKLLEPFAASLVAFLGVLLVWNFAHGSSGAIAGGSKSAAPDFTVASLEGKGQLHLQSFAGRLIVLNFFASWCGPCRQEAAGLARLAKTFDHPLVSFVGVDVRDAPGAARAFVRRYGFVFPVGHDNGGTSTAPYGVASLPATFIISPRGRIVDHATGFISENALRTELRRALAAST